MPELNGEAEITVHGNKIIFLNQVPKEAKKAIRKRFKEDKQFRDQIIQQCQREENTTDALKK